EALVGAVGLLDDLFQREVRKACFLGKLVAVVDIGLVVLVVVVFERLARHVGGEGVVIVGKRRKFESHVGVSSWRRNFFNEIRDRNIGAATGRGNRPHSKICASATKSFPLRRIRRGAGTEARSG